MDCQVAEMLNLRLKVFAFSSYFQVNEIISKNKLFSIFVLDIYSGWKNKSLSGNPVSLEAANVCKWRKFA